MKRVDFISNWVKPVFSLGMGEMWELDDWRGGIDFPSRYCIVGMEKDYAFVDIYHLINGSWVQTGCGFKKDIEMIKQEFKRV